MLNAERAPSPWVERFLPLIRTGGQVLDVAAGAGRHVRRLREHGFTVRAIDRDVSALRKLAGVHCSVHEVDLETGAPVALGGPYDGIVVTNYLHRPLFPFIEAALAPSGVLIYETFACGNERFGPPRNPDFLLRPNELIEAFGRLTVIAYEAGAVTHPRPAVIERLAAVNGPLGRLPEPGAPDATGRRAGEREAAAR